MKLTQIVFGWAKPKPAGNIWRGKYRMVKRVTPLRAANKRSEYEVEEKNMFYLRHPYLTMEQASIDEISNKEKYIEQLREERAKNWKNHSLLGDRFGFLKVADKWK